MKSGKAPISAENKQHCNSANMRSGKAAIRAENKLPSKQINSRNVSNYKELHL